MKVLSIRFNIDSKRYFIYFHDEIAEEIFCYQINAKTARKMISDFCFQKQNQKTKSGTENFISWS